jgi:hypothetical protein
MIRLPSPETLSLLILAKVKFTLRLSCGTASATFKELASLREDSRPFSSDVGRQSQLKALGFARSRGFDLPLERVERAGQVTLNRTLLAHVTVSSFHQLLQKSSSSIIWGLYNRPKWPQYLGTQSHPTNNKKKIG